MFPLSPSAHFTFAKTLANWKGAQYPLPRETHWAVEPLALEHSTVFGFLISSTRFEGNLVSIS